MVNRAAILCAVALSACSWDTPTIPCRSTADCPDGASCDTTAGHCTGGDISGQIAGVAHFSAKTTPYQVTLSWDLNPDTMEVIIYRATGSGAFAPIQVVNGNNTTGWTDTTVSPGTTYSYTATRKSQNTSNNNNSESARAPVQVVNVAPKPPDFTTFTAVGDDTTVHLTWATSAGATGYVVYRNGTAAGTVTTTSFDDAASNDPYYGVAAVNVDSVGPQTARTLYYTSAPTLQINGADTHVSISWTASTTYAYPTNVELYRSDDAGATYTQIATGSGFDDTTAPDAGSLYRIVAHFATYGTVTRTSAPVALPPRPAVSLQALDNGDVKLSWPAVSGAVSYYLTGGKQTAGSHLTTTSFTEPGPHPSYASYAYQVQATTANANSRPAAISVPPLIGGALAIHGADDITVSWTAVAGETQYAVSIQQDAGAFGPLIPVTGTSYVHSGAAPGSAYTYAVRVARPNATGFAITGDVPQKPSLSSVFASRDPNSDAAVYTVAGSCPAATDFRGERSDDSGATFNYEIGSSGPNFTLAIPTGPAGAQFRVATGSADSNYGTWYRFSDVIIPPAAPASLTVVAGSGKNTLSWPLVPGVDGYQVLRAAMAYSETAPVLATVVQPGSGTTVSFEDISPPAGASFYVVQSMKGIFSSLSTPEAGVPKAGFQYFGYTNPFSGTVAIADVDNDGWGDIIAASYYGAYVIKGGPAGFSQVSITPPVITGSFTPNGSAYQIAVADINGDGKPDFAFAGNSNNVIVVRSKGDGTYNTPESYAAGASVLGVLFADANHDTVQDLISSAYSGNTGQVNLGASGAFSTSPTTSAITNPGFIASGDFNGDGFPELIFATPAASNAITILAHGGTGAKTTLPGSNACSVAVGDMTKDGKLDVIATLQGSVPNTHQLVVYPGNGDGTFGTPIPTSLPSPCREGGLVVADFDGDGSLDAVVTQQDLNEILFFKGKGDGTFLAPVAYQAGGAYRVVTGDFDGDGKPDLLVSGNYLVAFLNRFY